MATWKKVVVSGSAAELQSLKIANNGLEVTGSVKAGLTSLSQANIVSYDTATGQFYYQGTGSFTAATASYVTSSNVFGPFGSNSILSASSAQTASRTFGTLSQGSGISPLSFNGSTNVTVAVSGAAQLTNNILTKWNSTDGKFVDSTVFDNGTFVFGNSSLRFTGADTQLTGSFSGSFIGDGSNLTGLATTLRITGSLASSSGSINLLSQGLIITGSASSISASIASGSAGVTVSLGFMPNVQVSNLTVNNDLTVLGTASFQNTQNLAVADRFILLASGSNTPGDGGLVVQQGTQDVGELFGYDSSAVRWGVTSSFSGSAASFTPDAFMAAVVVGSSGDPGSAPGRYAANGNLFIGNDETIWIFS